MKSFISVIILLFFHFNSYATISDSLESILKTETNSKNQLELLTEIGELHLKKMNFEKAEDVGFRLLTLAKTEEKQEKKLQTNTTAYHLLGRIYLRNGKIKKGKEAYLTSIEFQKSATKIDQPKLAWQLYNYGNFLKSTGNYEDAYNYFDQSYAIQKELGEIGKQGDCLLNSGAMHLYLGENTQAEKMLLQAYDIALAVNDTSSLNSITTNMASVYEIKGDYQGALHQLNLSENYAKGAYDLAFIYGNRGNIYFYLGKIDSAVYAYQKASGYFTSAGRMLENSMVLMELGVIFKNQKNYDQAFKMLQQAEEGFKKAKNNDFLTAVLINKGHLFDELEKQDSALYYFETALNYATETNNKNYIGICNQNIGILLVKKQKYKDALTHLNIAVSYFREMDDKRLMAESYNTLSDIYIKLKDYNKAESFLNEALAISENLDHVELKTKVYDSYIELFAIKLNAPKIYLYHNEQINLLDSLKAEANSKIVEDLNAQYHLQEKEDALKFINLDLERQQLISKTQEKQIAYAIIALIIFSILLIVVFISRKKVKEKNTENELLLGEIHHRVKNNLQVISSLLSLQERNIDDESAKAAILEGKERVKSMGLIHKMLYQNDNYSGVEMDDYVGKLVNGLLDSFGMDEANFKLDIDFSKLKLDVDTAIPMGLIINELVINSLKYAFINTEAPALKLKLKKEKEQLILEVADNGRGKVTDLENSNSFGMKLVKSLSRQLGGKLLITDQQGLNFQINITDYKLV